VGGDVMGATELIYELAKIGALVFMLWLVFR
jgi:hypothetical protein